MKAWYLLTVLALCQPTWADAPSDALKSKLNAMRTMSANFTQIVKAKKHEVSRSTGTMAIARPGHFRWQTKEPMEQLVIADGKNMWIYDVDLEQVTVKKQGKGLGGTAALFLSGYDDDLTRDFSVSQKSNGKSQIFSLTAKKQKESFQNIKLVFTNDALTGLELHDQLGQVTYVTLNQIKTNPKLQSKLFQFTPPKGVDVVEQ